MHLYTGQPLIAETFEIKLFPVIGILLQILEVVCYLVIYRKVYLHQQEMIANKIISRATYQDRKRVHIFSVFAQIAGFLVKLALIIFALIIRLLEQKVFLLSVLDGLIVVKTAQFGFVAMAEIFASPNLRQNFLAIFRHR